MESKEYSGDALYSSPFPFFRRLKKTLETDFFYGECRDDDGRQGVVIDDEEDEFRGLEIPSFSFRLLPIGFVGHCSSYMIIL